MDTKAFDMGNIDIAWCLASRTDLTVSILRLKKVMKCIRRII